MRQRKLSQKDVDALMVILRWLESCETKVQVSKTLLFARKNYFQPIYFNKLNNQTTEYLKLYGMILGYVKRSFQPTNLNEIVKQISHRNEKDI